MPVSLNGAEPIDVRFDTGAGALLSTNIARRLGLKLTWDVKLGGFGGDSRTAARATLDTVRIGGLVLHGVTFVVLDPPLAGSDEFAVIGAPLLSQAVVRINYTREQMTFTDPKRFHYSGTTSPIPINLLGNNVLVAGKVDGIPGTLSIDTGDAWSIELLTRFVQEHGLIQRYGAKFQGYAGSGIGGADQAYYARVHTLQIGNAKVHNTLALLFTDIAGGGATSTNAANIGTHVLRQFTITLDAPHRSLYLKKNSNYGHPVTFNRAGLILDGNHDGLTVRTVLPGSPGAAAGLHVGDQILEVDGQSLDQPTGTAALGEAVGMEPFLRPPGTTLRLTFRRNDSVQTVSVRLRNIL